MRHRSIKALYEYWTTLRGDRAAPARTEIDPRGIARELGDVFLLDGTVADFRFRLAGSRIVAALGQALTGARFERIWLERASDNARRALASAATEAEPILIGIRIFKPESGREPVRSPTLSPRLPPSWANFRDINGVAMPERRGDLVSAGEMLLLPLSQQNRIGTRILGALALFEPPLTPALTPQPLDISGTRILGRAARPNTGTGLLHGELAETVISRHGHLVLMRGLRPANDPANSKI